jgi:hypothetical protein
MSKRKEIRGAMFRLHPWKWDAVVLVGESTERVNRFIEGLGITPNAGTELGHAWVYDGKPAVLWVRTLRDVPVLVHEAIHLVSGVLTARGLKLCPESEEALTYGVEDLLRRIFAQRRWKVMVK